MPESRTAPPVPALPNAARLQHGQVAELSRQVVYRLAMLLKTLQLHHVGNEALRSSIKGFAGVVGELLAGQGEVVVRGDRDVAFVGHHRVRPEPLMFENLRRLLLELRQRGLGGLAIRRPVTAADVRQLLQVLIDHPRLPAHEGAALVNQQFAALGLDGVEALPLMTLVADEGPAPTPEGDVGASVRETYASLAVLVKTFHHYPGRVPDLVLDRTQSHLRRLVDHVLDAPETAVAMTTWWNAADYGCLHSVNMAVLAVLAGAALDLPRRSLLDLAGSALYADAGMKRLPPGLWSREESLAADEIELLHTHPFLSVCELIRYFPLAGEGRDRVVAAFEHHAAGPDGYPPTPPGRPAHLFAGLIAVVDAYDACVSQRLGEGEWLTPPEAVVRLRAAAGTRFDRAAVDAFVSRSGPWPVGTCLRLPGGEIAVVCSLVRPDRPGDRPRARIALEADGTRGDGRAVEVEGPGPAGPGGAVVVRASDCNVSPHGVLAGAGARSSSTPRASSLHPERG